MKKVASSLLKKNYRGICQTRLVLLCVMCVCYLQWIIALRTAAAAAQLRTLLAGWLCVCDLYALDRRRWSALALAIM